MCNRKLQRGMTFWSMSFVLAVIAIVVFLVLKLLPVYIEDYKVESVLETMAKQPDFATMSKQDIAIALAKRFDIDMVTTVDPNKHLYIESRGRGVKAVRITYEVVVPMVGNVSALLDFNHEKEVRGGVE